MEMGLRGEYFSVHLPSVPSVRIFNVTIKTEKTINIKQIEYHMCDNDGNKIGKKLEDYKTFQNGGQ